MRLYSSGCGGGGGSSRTGSARTRPDRSTRESSYSSVSIFRTAVRSGSAFFCSARGAAWPSDKRAACTATAVERASCTAAASRSAARRTANLPISPTRSHTPPRYSEGESSSPRSACGTRRGHVVDVAEGGRLAADRRLVAAQQHGATRDGEPMLEEGRLKRRVADVSGRRSRTGTGHEQGTPPPAPLACPSAQPAAARWGAA